MGLALAQIPFIINVFYSIKNGKKVTNDNPWEATTLEWQTPTPPPHGNFAHAPTVYRGPVRIQRARRAEGFHAAERSLKPPSTDHSWKSPTHSSPGPTPASITPRSASGCSSRRKSCCSARLFSAYILLRVGAPPDELAARPAQHSHRHVQHRGAHRFRHHGGDGVGGAEDEEASAGSSCFRRSPCCAR